MKEKELKSVRFDALVKACGAPEQVTLWAMPGPGSDFMKAVDENRVATVVQHNTGTGKDYGVIGFETLPNATFLLFPKPLPYAAGTKIIGIKYERLAESKPFGRLYEPQEKQPARQHRMSKARTDQEAVAPMAAADPRKRERNPLEDSRTESATVPEKSAPAPPKPKLPPKPPVVHRFRATVELLAKQTVEIEVSATSMKEAAELLTEKAHALSMNLEAAEVARKVSKPKRAEE